MKFQYAQSTEGISRTTCCSFQPTNSEFTPAVLFLSRGSYTFFLLPYIIPYLLLYTYTKIHVHETKRPIVQRLITTHYTAARDYHKCTIDPVIYYFRVFYTSSILLKFIIFTEIILKYRVICK